MYEHSSKRSKKSASHAAANSSSSSSSSAAAAAAAAAVTSHSTSNAINSAVRGNSSNPAKEKNGGIPSYWNGDSFICTHSPSFDLSKSLPPPPTPFTSSSSSSLSSDQLLNLSVHHMTLLQAILRYLNKSGMLKVNDIKLLFPGYEQDVIKIANILCSVRCLHFFIPPTAKDCSEGVYVTKDRLEGEACELITKDISEKEKEELMTLRKRVEMLEKAIGM